MTTDQAAEKHEEMAEQLESSGDFRGALMQYLEAYLVQKRAGKLRAASEVARVMAGLCDREADEMILCRKEAN